MTHSSQQSPAVEVWRRFTGMFGADAVERKFGKGEIPPEWVAMCSRLNEYQIQRGIRQLAYSGKAHVPSLPEFVKLCRDAEHDVRPSTVHPALTNHGAQMSPWELLGNRRLLKYITTVVSAKPQRYGRPASSAGMKPVEGEPLSPNADASPEFVRNVQTLVAMKNRWVELMLAAATEEGVPIVEQDDCWNACMKQAEEIIANAA